MGFGRYKNVNQAELLHKIELFDFATGDPAVVNGRRQYIVIRGEKSRAYQNAVEREQAQAKRKGKDSGFSFEESAKTLARRLSEITVAAFIDVSDTDEPKIVQFDNIDTLSEQDRENARADMRNLYAEVTDLALLVNEEVTKGANFLPGRGQTLSSLFSNASGIAPSQTAASQLG